MPSLTYFSAVVVLPTLSAIGVLTTWTWSYNNHLFEDIVNVVESPNPQLPGTSHALLQWTSIPPLDRFLAILVTFFYPPINGSDPTAALQAFHFAGQLVAIWTLILLESVRPTNKGRLISRYNPTHPNAFRINALTFVAEWPSSAWFCNSSTLQSLCHYIAHTTFLHLSLGRVSIVAIPFYQEYTTQRVFRGV